MCIKINYKIFSTVILLILFFIFSLTSLIVSNLQEKEVYDQPKKYSKYQIVKMTEANNHVNVKDNGKSKKSVRIAFDDWYECGSIK